ncbi:MAG: hypothetical protein Wins2KO_22850 [Winogradskyella sp.]
MILLNACQTEKSERNENTTSTDLNLYLGQKQPGLIPEIFVPNKNTSQDWKLGNPESLNLDEFYFTYTGNNPFEPLVVVYRNEGNSYKANKYKFNYNPSDSNTLYSRWNYIERTNSGWSEMRSLGPMFERKEWGIMTLSISNKGTIVIDDVKSNDVIRISEIKDGKREEPKLMSKEINTGKWTAHPFIAPNESYLIWDSEREEGYGGADIYISFRQEDGSWGKAINLGDKINTKFWENAAKITPDGKYLGFSRSEEKVREDGSTYWTSDKYWVSAEVIEKLRPKK